MARRLTRIVPVLVTVGIAIAIAVSTDWTSLGSVLGRLDPAVFAAAASLQLLAVGVQAFRWALCFNRGREHVSYLFLTRVTVESYFFNNAFLAFVGGDVYRGYRATQRVGVREAAGSLLLVRITMLWGALLIPGPVLLAEPSFLAGTGLRTPLIVLSLGSVAACFLVPVLRGRLCGLGDPAGASRVRRLVASAARSPLLAPGALFLLLVTSLGFQALGIGTYFLCARALEIDIGPAAMSAVVPVVLVVSSLPISVNGFGVREGVAILALAHFGVVREDALAVAILVDVTLVALSVLGGALFLSGAASARRNAP